MDQGNPPGSGNVVRSMRMDLGLSQRQLADRCKAAGYPISDSQISKIERNISEDLWPSTWLGLALGLGVDVKELRKAMGSTQASAA